MSLITQYSILLKQTCSSVVEHPVYIGRVIGSIPIISTIKIKNGVVDERYFAQLKIKQSGHPLKERNGDVGLNPTSEQSE
jgi:hypothetical protein